MKKLLLTMVMLIVLILSVTISCGNNNDNKTDLFTVTFVEGEGIDAITNKVEKNSKLNKPTDPTKVGYIFEGWYLNDFEWQFDKDLVNSDIILVAKWEEEFYTKNLEYNLSDKDDTYEVVGLGTVTDTEITIPKMYNGKEVTSIADNAFADCDNIISVKIPTTVSSIGEYAFAWCDNLIDITIGKNVATMGTCAFRGSNKLIIKCELLAQPLTWHYSWFDSCPVVWDCSNNNIADNGNVYYNDKGVIYSIKNDVATICHAIDTITQLEIPTSINAYGKDYSVECIAEDAFSLCGDLLTVKLPSSITTIERFPFADCDKLVVYCEVASKLDGWHKDWNYYWNASYHPIVWDCNNNNVATDGNMYYVEKGIMYRVKDNEASVCNSVSSIKSANILPAVTINGVSYKVTSIADGDNLSDDWSIYDGTVDIVHGKAFYACKNLTSVTIPSSIKSIGNGAFSDCTKLVAITIPNSVISVGNGAFVGCTKLSVVTIGEGVESIGTNPFALCENLKDIIVADKNNSFTSVDGNLYNEDCSKLIVYASGKSSNEFKIPKNVIIIGSYAFFNCKNLISVGLLPNVLYIEDYAFSGCKYLTIYSVYTSKQEGWQDEWNYENCPVEWGYVGYLVA